MGLSLRFHHPTRWTGALRARPSVLVHARKAVGKRFVANKQRRKRPYGHPRLENKMPTASTRRRLSNNLDHNRKYLGDLQSQTLELKKS